MTGMSFHLILIRNLLPGYTILFEETEVQKTSKLPKVTQLLSGRGSRT